MSPAAAPPHRTTDGSATDGVRRRLRAASAREHGAVDGIISTGGLLDSPEGYRHLLRALAEARRIVEATFGGLALDERGACLARGDDDALTADLRALGDDVERAPTTRVDVATDPRAWGAVYVFEGSRLGGPAIAERARRLGDLPVSYFDREPPAVRLSRWRGVCDDLERRAAVEPAVAGALAAFSVVRRSITDASAAAHAHANSPFGEQSRTHALRYNPSMTEAVLSVRDDGPGGPLVAIVRGEVDIANAAALAGELWTAIAATSATSVVIEIATTHVGAAGVNALVELRASSPVPITVRCDLPGATSRILAMFGLLDP